MVNHVDHLKTGHEQVQYSDESGIQVYGFRMPSVFDVMIPKFY